MTFVMMPDEETLRTSWTLVARLKNLGDERSWEDFDVLYRPLILGVARKAGLTREEADEVVQETMAALCKHIEGFKAGAQFGSFRAWLLNMARWRIADQFRKRAPGTAASGSGAGDETARTPTVERVPNANEADLEELCDAEWKARLLERALQDLQLEVKASHYQIFHLLTVEQKSVEEVGRMVGRNRAWVYLVKHRVGKVLKVILARLEMELG